MSKLIEVDSVSMCFKVYKEKIDSLKEYFIKKSKGAIKCEEFWALRDISFSLDKGESLGIVGTNGSGKSTLLKLIAGVMKPTLGTVSIKGSIAPLIELGAGFDSDLTARENIYLNGAILGYSNSDMEAQFNNIIEFSELEEFIDIPVKNFSSGMYARLGFAIATIYTPDILIVDEILSVGDFKFQEKCHSRIKNMISAGTTLLFVSHSIDQIESLCSKVLWLEKGYVKMFSDSLEVCSAYKAS